MTIRQLAEPVNVHTLHLPHATKGSLGGGVIYSNADRAYDDATVEAVRSGRALATHTGGDFCGYVWFAGGVWCETVYVYGTPVAAYCAPGLPDLIDHVNGIHGFAT